jgi:hypothetical protein
VKVTGPSTILTAVKLHDGDIPYIYIGPHLLYANMTGALPLPPQRAEERCDCLRRLLARTVNDIK